jgi:hypothetical protein
MFVEQYQLIDLFSKDDQVYEYVYKVLNPIDTYKYIYSKD